MPIIGSRGAASARGFGFGGGIRTTGTYWYATATGTIGIVAGPISQSGYLVSLGSNSTSGGTEAVRFNSTGTIGYKTGLATTIAASTRTTSYDIVVGSYYYNGDASRSYAAFYALNNSAGTGSNRNSYYYSSGAGQYTQFICASGVSDTQCYAAGILGSSGAFYGFIASVNPTTTAASGFFFPGVSASIVSVASDSSYVYALTSSVSGDWAIVKLNTSLSVVWSKALSRASGVVRDGKIAVDSSGNVYVAGIAGTTPTGIDLIKLDSSGALLLQKYISITDAYTVGLAVSSSGSDSYIYVCYPVYASKSSIIAKLARSDFSLDSAVSISTSTADYIEARTLDNSVDYSVLEVGMGTSVNYQYTSYTGTLKISTVFSGMYGTFKDELNPANTITLASASPTIISSSNTFSSLSLTTSALSPALGTSTPPSVSSGQSTTRGKFYVIQP